MGRIIVACNAESMLWLCIHFTCLRT